MRREVQEDGTIRFWGRVLIPGESRHRFLRVITLEDGETIHSAFFDRKLPGEPTIRLRYYPETDSLYIELKSTPGADTREIVEGLTVDLDASGDIVGFDIDRASHQSDLSKIETIALPAATAAE